MQVGPKGQVNYIASGFSNQFGVETQIISVICKLSFFQAGCRFTPNTFWGEIYPRLMRVRDEADRRASFRIDTT